MLQRKMLSAVKSIKVNPKKPKDGRFAKRECAFGCGVSTGPQGYGNHVKGKHPEEYKIGLRLSGVVNPLQWTKQMIADIRAVQRADKLHQQAEDAEYAEYEEDKLKARATITPAVHAASMEVTPGCGTRVEEQVEDLVKHLTIAETQHVFYTVLHLKLEAEQEKLRIMLDSIRPQF